MDQPWLLDTDVLIDHLRGYSVATSFIEARADHVLLSSVVVAELYAGVKGDREQNQLDELVASFPVVPVTATIAREAGMLKRTYGPSHGVGLADAIVAATAQHEHASIATLNVKHYPMFSTIEPAYRK